MFSWLCSKCDRTSYSASAERKKEFVQCGYEDCKAGNINPYYTGRGEDEQDIHGVVSAYVSGG